MIICVGDYKMKLFKRQKPISTTRRGDTMIEVLLASAIFGFIALLTVTLMNSGMRISQSNLQLTMARNEVNAQAEALRYIHNAYVSSPGSGSGEGAETPWNQYKELWDNIASHAVDEYTKAPDGVSCQEVYDQEIDAGHTFVLNTVALQLGNTNTLLDNAEFLLPTDSFPFLAFSADNTLEAAYGIWVNAVGSSTTNAHGDPQYYEFFINTCWDSVGTGAPTRLDTVLRLYNPNYWVEEYR